MRNQSQYNSFLVWCNCPPAVPISHLRNLRINKKSCIYRFKSFTQHKVLFRLSFRPWVHFCSLVLAAKGSDCSPSHHIVQDFSPFCEKIRLTEDFRFRTFSFVPHLGGRPWQGRMRCQGKDEGSNIVFSEKITFDIWDSTIFYFLANLKVFLVPDVVIELKLAIPPYVVQSDFTKASHFFKFLFCGAAAAHHRARFLLWVDWAAN